MSRAKKAGSNNLLGCLLGCGAIAFVTVLLVLGGIFYMFRFGRLAAAPKTDTTALITSDAALSLRVDLEVPTAFSLAQLEDTKSPQFGSLLQMFRPYEGALSFSVSPDGREVYAGAALSSPRGASVLARLLEDARSELETNGRAFTNIGVDPERPGVLSLRMLMPSPVEAPGLRGEAWPSPTPGTAPALDKGHFISVMMDNRNGDAGLVCAALAQSVGEEPQGAPLVAPGGTPNPALSLLSQVRIIKGSRLLSTLIATADFNPEGNLLVEIGVEATNEVSAMLLMSTLGGLPEQLAKAWEPSGIQVTGSFQRNGAHIAGQLTFAGVIEQMRKAMIEYNERGGIGGFAEGEVFPPLGGVAPTQH